MKVWEVELATKSWSRGSMIIAAPTDYEAANVANNEIECLPFTGVSSAEELPLTYDGTEPKVITRFFHVE